LGRPNLGNYVVVVNNSWGLGDEAAGGDFDMDESGCHAIGTRQRGDVCQRVYIPVVPCRLGARSSFWLRPISKLGQPIATNVADGRKHRLYGYRSRKLPQPVLIGRW